MRVTSSLLSNSCSGIPVGIPNSFDSVLPRKLFTVSEKFLLSVASFVMLLLGNVVWGEFLGQSNWL